MKSYALPSLQRVAFAAVLMFCAMSASMPAQADPRCDGFPPRDHREAEPRGDVVGWVAGPCVGQLFPIVSSANTDSDLASITGLRVEKSPRYGRFEMTGLRNFRYAPSASIRGMGWDEVRLRLTIESEYQRMRAGGTLN